MKNLVKNSFYAGAWIALVGLNNVALAIDVVKEKPTTTWDQNQSGSFITTLDNILWYVIWLLYFIAVAFALYGGFQILTASGDEEKVKSWKTTLINAVIGLVVIFLASQIITWVIWIWNRVTQW